MNIKAFAPVVTIAAGDVQQDGQTHTLREFAATLNNVACSVRLAVFKRSYGVRYMVSGINDSGAHFAKSHNNLSDAEADYHHQAFPLMITASMMLGEMARQMEELSSVIDTRADVINAAHAAEQGE